MPLHNLDDIDARDLSEAPRLAKDPQSTGLLIGVATAAVLFIALLIYASLPELSPAEIVAMEGYEGEQPTKYIFNIHSLDDEAEVASAGEAPTDTLPPIAPTEPIPDNVPVTTALESTQAAVVVSEQPVVVTVTAEVDESVPAETALASTDVATAEVVQAELVQVEPQQTESTVSAEQPIAATQTVVTEPAPAVTEVAIAADSVQISDTDAETPRPMSFNTDRKKVVAAMATTPTIEESADTVVVASVAVAEPIPLLVSSSSPVAEVNGKGKLLPLRSIRQDATELKASPSTRSRTLLSLKRGVVVTAFERYGDWIHIGTNDGSSITGYVLEASLGAVDSKSPG